MPTIWMELKQQTDRASRETIMAAFFNKIADEDMEPSLRNFSSNQAFFDDVIGLQFTPGTRTTPLTKDSGPFHPSEIRSKIRSKKSSRVSQYFFRAISEISSK
jgi:hypothetical protein